MMNRSRTVVLVGILLVACGKEGTREPSAGSQSPETAGAATHAGTAASTGPAATEAEPAPPPAADNDPAAVAASTDSAATPPDPEEEESATTPAVADARHPLFGFQMNGFDFLGWTADGGYFVLAATHRDQPGEGIESWRVELHQVHDALTGQVVASYQIASAFPKAGDTDTDYWPEAQVRGAWQQARPREDWKAWLAAHPLVKNDPTTSAQGWKITAQLLASSVRKEDKFEIDARSQGFYSRWELLAGEVDWDDPEVARVMKRKPRVLLSTTKAGESWKSITYHVPFTAAAGSDETYGLMGIGREHWDKKTGSLSAEPVVITGSMRPFWSPRGDRIVWAMYHSFDGVPKPLRAELGIAHYYLRTPGPQIRLVDAGIGDQRARVEAARFAEAGLPITVLGTAKKPAGASEIYYRGAQGRTVAERVAKLVGGDPAIQELKTSGYLDVVIVLAPDQAKR